MARVNAVNPSESPQTRVTSTVSRKWLRPLLLVGVPLAVLAGAAMVWLWSGRFVTTDNAYVKADIAQVSSEVAGRVMAVEVRDHSPVRAGDVLVRLDPEPYRIALARADAEADASRGAVRTLVAAFHEASSELAEAQNRVAYTKSQLDRHRQLAGRGVVSTAKLEEIEDAAKQAADKVVVAKAKVDRTLASLGNQPERPIDLHPLVREKLSQRERAALDLARTTITAPVDGVAVNVKTQLGEQVRAQVPMFAIVSSTRPWVEANFKETDLTHVRPGQIATVVLDIYPDVTFEAEIETISPATGAEFALLPPQNASGNWVKVVQRLPVKLRLHQRAGEPPLRAGMTASVKVDTGRQRKLADLIGWTASATGR